MNNAGQINSFLRRMTDADDEQTITVQQRFDTTAADLWEACTTPERLARWFEPAHVEAHVGGRHRVIDSGTEGRKEQCEPPSLSRGSTAETFQLSRTAPLRRDDACLHSCQRVTRPGPSNVRSSRYAAIDLGGRRRRGTPAGPCSHPEWIAHPWR